MIHDSLKRWRPLPELFGPASWSAGLKSQAPTASAGGHLLGHGGFFKSGNVRVDNLAGWFTIRPKGEPHLPQLWADGNPSVCEVVVKIPAHLVA